MFCCVFLLCVTVCVMVCVMVRVFMVCFVMCFVMCLTSQAIRGMSHEDMVRTMTHSQCKIAITSHM